MNCGWRPSARSRRSLEALLFCSCTCPPAPRLGPGAAKRDVVMDDLTHVHVLQRPCRRGRATSTLRDFATSSGPCKEKSRSFFGSVVPSPRSRDGNVYVKFGRRRAKKSSAALDSHGRYYTRRPIKWRVFPVTDFRESTCRRFAHPVALQEMPGACKSILTAD